MSDTGKDLGAAAAWYAGQGVPVFPCKSRTKKPLTRHGFKDATTDLARIGTWWRRSPDANIGIPTGGASGLMAVDIDPRNGGEDSLDELLAIHGAFPETAEQMTGGGGRHIIFRESGIIPSTKVLAPGIDLKGEGGYIVVAPSIHPSGNRYQWDGVEGVAALLKPAAAPAWLLERITAVPTVARVQSPGARIIQTPNEGEKWRPGERNTRLTSLAGAVRRCGMTRAAMEAALLEENLQRCDPPLDTVEVRKIAGSVARYPAEVSPSGSNLEAFIPLGYESAFAALLDVLRFAADLPEFRVLLFHVERSLGYGKQSDCTSLSQMVEGILSRKLNTWVRKGCGLKKAAVVRANKSLARPDRQFLRVRRRSSPENGNEPTEYELNWEMLTRYIAEKRKQQPIPPLVSQPDKPLVSQRDTHNHYQGGKGTQEAARSVAYALKGWRRSGRVRCSGASRHRRKRRAGRNARDLRRVCERIRSPHGATKAIQQKGERTWRRRS